MPHSDPALNEIVAEWFSGLVNWRMTIEASELTGKEKVGVMFSLELEDWMCEANTMTAEQGQLTVKL